MTDAVRRCRDLPDRGGVILDHCGRLATRIDISPMEAGILALACLAHAATRRSFEVIADLPRRIAECVATIVASNSGVARSLEYLDPEARVKDHGDIIRIRCLAAIHRLCRTIVRGDLGPHDPQIEDALMRYVIVLFDFDAREIVISIAGESTDFGLVPSNICAPDLSVFSSLLRYARVVEMERRYCCYLLPEGARLDHVRLRISDGVSVQPWFNQRIDRLEFDLLAPYQLRPDLLVQGKGVGKSPRTAALIGEIFLGPMMALLGPDMVSLVLYGSVARQATRPNDIDLLVLTPRDIEPSLHDYIRRLIQEGPCNLIVNSKAFGDWRVPANLTFWSVPDFVVHLSIGDPFSVSLTCEGMCLLSSSVFAGLKSMLSDCGLAFPREPLLKHLWSKAERANGETGSFDRSLGSRPFVGFGSMYRAMFSLAQRLVLRQRKGSVRSSEILPLCRPDGLLESLTSVDANIAGFLRRFSRQYKVEQRRRLLDGLGVGEDSAWSLESNYGKFMLRVKELEDRHHE